MEFSWADEDLAFRKEVRAFLETALADRWHGPVTHLGSKENIAWSFEFCGLLAERGWLTPHWPVEYGGNDASPWQHAILGEELWSVGEPRGPQYMNVNWIGPSIMGNGTDEQKQQHLPPIAAGKVIWCQGFSEPDAGSDLVSLRTRAVRDGDEYVVDGHKIWTSYADVAEWCYLLTRTSTDGPRHDGITVLLVRTDTPGFQVRKIPGVVGEHSFNEIWLDDVRVPAANRLGPEGGGWKVVREALSYERVGAPRWARAAVILDEVARWAQARCLLDDPRISEQMGEARAACEAARMLCYKVIDERVAGLPPSANANVARAAMVEAERRVGKVVTRVMGMEGLAYGSPADHQRRKSMAAGLAAGSYEMQLNLIARMHLGLPSGS
jgi:alkylation response protein AidB-like acyl-CoA dehydrogenase